MPRTRISSGRPSSRPRIPRTAKATAPKLGQIDLFTRRIKGMPPPLEFRLHCMVADILQDYRNPGWRYNHIASGEYRPPATAARLKRMGVQPGWPDFIVIGPKGKLHFLELKRRGEGLSEAQEEFFAWCHEEKIKCEWTDDFKIAINTLKEWGAVQSKVSV